MKRYIQTYCFAQTNIFHAVHVKTLQIPMRVQGLSEDGFLQAIDTFGQVHILHPDGNSLDMMTGLVSKKV